MHPCDDVSTKALTMQLPDLGSPSYMRTARNKTPVLYDGREGEIQIGKGIVLSEGNDVAIVACGVLVHEALTAAENLKNEGIHATVVDMHTIKPLDTELLDRLAKQCGAIVTAEGPLCYWWTGRSRGRACRLFTSGSNRKNWCQG